MAPDQTVRLLDVTSIRNAVNQYIMDNVGWRAEDQTLVWSHRYVCAKLSLLHEQTMLFADLVGQVQAALSETSSELIRFLTAELMAERICIPVAAPPPADTLSSAENTESTGTIGISES